MKKIYLYYFLLTILVSISACSGTKKYYKKGLTLEEANMQEEAADMYLTSVTRNPKNVQAKIALKRTGQIVLDRKLSQVFKGNETGDYEKAVNSFLDAQRYQEKVAKQGVKLTIAPQYKTYFKASKEKYLSDLYQRGTQLLEKEAFEEADALFAEIIRITPNYKDVKTLKNASTNEPLYRKGVVALEANHFKEAYRYLNQVVRKDKTYKDAYELREDARKQALLTISLLPFSNTSFTRNAQERFKADITSSLTRLKHPFIELVDRENLQAILEEQKLAMSGLLDEQSAAKVGELLGVKAVMTGKVVTFKPSTGQWQAQEKIGYEAYNVRKLDTTTNKYVNETRYKKVIYSEHSNQKQLNVAFQYQLVSSETGKVLLSNVINRKQQDALRYASYSGDYRNLYPGSTKSVFTSKNDKSRLNQLFASRKEFKSNEDMAKLIYQDIAQQVAKEVKNYVEN
ncbi:MAG: CsgG/HfaB family protein [Thermonemataceae bacterium]